ncbi:MAG: hypothetical protein ACI4E1_05780 [Lachnospira sp.]
MNISEARREITNSVQAYLLKDNNGKYKIPPQRRRPLLVIGGPGVGKTQMIEEIAIDCNIGLVMDTIGDKASNEYFYSRAIGKREGIILINGINSDSLNMTQVMMNLICKRKLEENNLSDGWIVVMEVDCLEDKKIVSEINVSMLDKVRVINVEADYNVWKRYANERHLHGAIRSYLELNPDDFYKVSKTKEGNSIVTARGWENLSAMVYIYQDLGLKISEQEVYEFLRNKEIASNVIKYIDNYGKCNDYYSVKEILEDGCMSNYCKRMKAADKEEQTMVTYHILDALNASFTEAKKMRSSLDKHNEWLRLQKAEKNFKEDFYDIEKEVVLLKTDEVEEYESSVVSYVDNSIEFLEFCGDISEIKILISGLSSSAEAEEFLRKNPSALYLQYRGKHKQHGNSRKIIQI